MYRPSTELTYGFSNTLVRSPSKRIARDITFPRCAGLVGGLSPVRAFDPACRLLQSKGCAEFGCRKGNVWIGKRFAG
jgi:hypothetical protein